MFHMFMAILKLSDNLVKLGWLRNRCGIGTCGLKNCTKEFVLAYIHFVAKNLLDKEAVA